MEIKQIKELMSAMGRTGTKKLSIKKEGFELHLERQENSKLLEISTEEIDEAQLKEKIALQRTSMALSKGKEIPIGASQEKTADQLKETQEGLYITSPMVGTFYTSPSPDDPAFVTVGSRVEKQTLVCIIEAMKVMNEVKAGVAGTVVELLVESGHPVEFGTKLFRIT
jgi:acetyl-CoA carboxylase biotin carboxyl carrier protein